MKLGYIAVEVSNDLGLWCCRQCGSLIGNRAIHDDWHNTTRNTLSNISSGVEQANGRTR